MQAQERESAEQAEKRLKAALTAKREPSAASRVVSPTPATVEGAPTSEESQLKEGSQEDNASKDVAMDVVDVAVPSLAVTEVGTYPLMQSVRY